MQRREQLKKMPLADTRSIDDKLARFKQIVNIYDPKAKPKYSGGYLHYISDDPIFKGQEGRRIHAPGTPYHGKWFDELQFQLGDELVNGTKEQQAIARKILCSEYKIHLMPKPEYILPVIEKIMQAAKTDPEFANLIDTFKIYPRADAERGGEIFANVVIYIRLGDENATRFLEKLHKLFSPYDLNEIAEPSNLIPRRNVQINNLMYYSQGGSDVKKEIIAQVKDEDLGEYLTKFQRHYTGGKKLNVTSPKKAGEQSDQKHQHERKRMVEQRNNVAGYTEIETEIYTAIKSRLGNIFKEIMPHKLKKIDLYQGHEGATAYPHLRLIFANNGKQELLALKNTFTRFGIKVEEAHKNEDRFLMIPTTVPLDNLFSLMENLEESYAIEYQKQLKNIEEYDIAAMRAVQQQKPAGHQEDAKRASENIKSGRYFHNSGNYAIVTSIRIHDDLSMTLYLRDTSPGDTKDKEGRKNDKSIFEHRRNACEIDILKCHANKVATSDKETSYYIEDPDFVKLALRFLALDEMDEPYSSGCILNVLKHFEKLKEKADLKKSSDRSSKP